MASIPRFSLRLAAKINRNQNLRTRLGIAIGSIAFLLSISASLIVGHTISEQVKCDVGRSLAELAYQMTDKLDRGIFEHYRDLQTISTLHVFSNHHSLSQQRVFLKKLQSTDNDFAWISLVDRKGVVVASTNKPLEDKFLSQTPLFVKRQKASYVSEVDKAMKVAELSLTPTGKPQHFLNLLVPMTDFQGHPQGVLSAYFNWNWAYEVEKSLLHSLDNKIEIFVLSQNGDWLLTPPKFKATSLSLKSLQAAKGGMNDYVIENWFDNHTYLTGFAKSVEYRGLGWLVLVRQKTDVVYSTVWHLQQQVFIWNMVLWGLFAVLGLLATMAITNPSLAIAVAGDCNRAGDRQPKQLEDTRLALEKEREMSELKSQFIAIACHEFRSPLTTILLSCDFLRNYSDKISEEKKQRIFTQMKCSIKHLNQVLEDVLLISRSQVRKLQFNPTPLHLTNFCLDLVEQLRLSAGEQHHLNFISQCAYDSFADDMPLVDEKLLRQILTNLLSNAIKYSPQGGNIQFNLICDRNSVIFCIQDEGIGIPKEDKANIFTSFFRCSNTGKLPGTGLGLTIVKNAVELHGGHMTVESELGLGTTFTVILPLNHTIAGEKNFQFL
ncbi:MAG: ATP-binding protein [Rhizonema sp. NSF051]|nr:ATP-binding protein [Rhizonema sp. NSF051]